MILIVEGLREQDCMQFARKVNGKTGWPMYCYGSESLVGLEREGFARRDKMVSFIESMKVDNVMLVDFYMRMAIDGVVDGGWLAMTTVGLAESLSKRLSDLGAVLVRCNDSSAVKTPENVFADKVRTSMFDLLYDMWPGEKRTTSVLEFDHTIYNLRI